MDPDATICTCQSSHQPHQSHSLRVSRFLLHRVSDWLYVFPDYMMQSTAMSSSLLDFDGLDELSPEDIQP